MGLFDFLKGIDINEAIEEFKTCEKGILVDVRTPGEYKGGHIPKSINVPLDSLSSRFEKLVKNKDATVFVYCLSGSRSSHAAKVLTRMGYTHVKDIGGVGRYKGRLEK